MAAAISAQQPVELQLEEARQSFDSAGYDTARALLDDLVARLSAPADQAERQVLVSAYELRGRVRLETRDPEGARADFRNVLLIQPSYQLSALATPRAQMLYEEVRRGTVGDVEIAVTPGDAVITLDGVRLEDRPSSITLAGGTHMMAAARPGYTSASRTFVVVPGGPAQPVVVALERETSTVTFSTLPADVEVVLDGVSRGRTSPPDLPASPDSGVIASSKPFVLPELPSGRHRLTLRRECFTTSEQDIQLDRPGDLEMGVQRLAPAVASVAVTSDAQGATVYLDGVARGDAPLVLSDICHGEHVVEVRTASGRDLRRFDLTPGDKETFAARVRPALAIVSDNGLTADVQGGPDLKLRTAAAFRDSQAFSLYVPPAAQVSDATAAEKLPADWLAFDAFRRPVGGAALLDETARRRLTARLGTALGVQGIAAISRDPAGDRSTLLLVVFAAGSGRPDVIPWKVDDSESLRDALARLDGVPAVTRTSIGLSAIDVLDVTGVVAARVDPAAGAGRAGVQAGEVITSAGGQPVTSVAQLNDIVSARTAGSLPLELRARSGAAKAASIAVERVPYMGELFDQTVPSNLLAVQYASRATRAATPLEEVSLRLNRAAALVRLGVWTDAAREADLVLRLGGDGKISPVVKDLVEATAHYLRGEAAAGTGDAAVAEREWRLSSQSAAAMPTDSAERFKEVSERRMAQLRQSTENSSRP